MHAAISRTDAAPIRMTRQRRQVLDLVTRKDQPPTLGEIVRCCGLERATAKRVLKALRDAGMIGADAWAKGNPGRPRKR